MHLVDIMDDGILRNDLVLVATFLKKTLAWPVHPAIDCAPLAKPFHQAAIHHTDIFDAKVAKRVGRPHSCRHASTSIIADDLVITVHAHVLHVRAEILSAWQRVGVWRRYIHDLGDVEKLGRLCQTLPFVKFQGRLLIG